MVQEAGERIRERYGDVADEARERYEQAEEIVRSNPAQSVAAAFGFGLVIGLAFGIALRFALIGRRAGQLSDLRTNRCYT